MPRTACFLLMCAVAPLAAQQAPRKDWIDHLYPYAYYSSIDGFWGGGHYDWSSPIGFTERPEPNWAYVPEAVSAVRIQSMRRAGLTDTAPELTLSA